MSPHLRAISFALAGYALWVLGDTTLKLSGSASMPKYEIVMIGALSGMAVIFAVTLWRGELVKLRPKHYRGLSALGFFYSCNYFIFAWVLSRLPLANFYTVIFLSPMVIAILAALFLRESLSWKHSLAILAGFGGVVIAINPVGIFNDMNHWLVYGAVFGGMMGNALQMLLLRVLGPYESRECLAFYPRVAGLICALAAGIILGFKPIPVPGLVYALLSGAFGGMGHLCMAHAYKLAPAATVAPFHYSQLIVGALLGYLIWHDVPTLHVLTGAVVIIGSGLYIAAHARKTGMLARTLAENADI